VVGEEKKKKKNEKGAPCRQEKGGGGGGDGRRCPLVLNLGTGWIWSTSRHRPLYPR